MSLMKILLPWSRGQFRCSCRSFQQFSSQRLMHACGKCENPLGKLMFNRASICRATVPRALKW